jgi:predicted nucleotidyltransferase
LQDALRSAAAVVADAEFWLFGSRATGTAAETSDYDLALVVPDDLPLPLRGMAMGEVWSAVRRHGARADHQLVLAPSFMNPTDKDRALVSKIKSYGFRVPVSVDPGPSAQAVPVR